MVVTRSPEATQAVASLLADQIRPGDVLLLGGDLGAGKTTFTQGLGRALGVRDRIVSPTFTIERVYAGRVELHHLDVYRLESLHEVLDLGLGEALDDGGVAVVEWGEAIAPIVGMDHLQVHLALGERDDERHITVTPVGDGWATRVETFRTVVATSDSTGTDPSTGDPA